MASSPHPYIANTDEDRRRMLDAVGVATSDELFADIPPEFRIDGLDLPPALSELLWVRPSMVRPLVEGTRRIVETVPLVGREELRYWSDLMIVLEPLLKRDLVLLEVGADGSAAMRFEGPG